MNVAQGFAELVGHTPLVKLAYWDEYGAAVLAKLECFNPGGSSKDRVALAMIEQAEQQGLLRAGAVIVESTSGNTGVGLAAVAASRGYRVILTMPENMSEERKRLLAAYGAELVLTPAEEGVAGATRKAQEIAASLPDSFLPKQFENPANPFAHYSTTGPEIWEDTDGQVDIFVAGVGTGGTLSGTGAYLKSRNPAIRVVAVEPAGSAVLSGKPAGAHGLQGIGAGFIPDTLDTGIYDEIIAVTEQEAYAAARLLARREGLLTGITSGAALHAAAVLAKRPENRGKTIVALLPDTGERYLSTPLFTEN